MSTQHPAWVQRMRRLQHERGWTGRELASRAGVSCGSISLYINAKRGVQVRPSTLKKFAKVFGEPERLWLELGGFDGSLPS